jgi:hypothetical protein
MQGDVICPILFAIYVNDCEMEFLNNCCQPVELKELRSIVSTLLAKLRCQNVVTT